MKISDFSSPETLLATVVSSLFCKSCVLPFIYHLLGNSEETLVARRVFGYEESDILILKTRFMVSGPWKTLPATVVSSLFLQRSRFLIFICDLLGNSEETLVARRVFEGPETMKL